MKYNFTHHNTLSWSVLIHKNMIRNFVTKHSQLTNFMTTVFKPLQEYNLDVKYSNKFYFK